MDSFNFNDFAFEDEDLSSRCPVCYDPLLNVSALGCGHIIHMECLEKHFKAECPICRTSQTRIKPKGRAPKSSPGRSIRYVSPNSHEEKISIKTTGDSGEHDRTLIEEMLTKKHRGEKLSKENAQEYKDAIRRVGSFTMTIINI